jgi:hypothetical protein
MTPRRGDTAYNHGRRLDTIPIRPIVLEAGAGMGVAYALPAISASDPAGGPTTVVGDRVAITGDVPLGSLTTYCSVVPISLSVVSTRSVTDRVGAWTGTSEMKLLFYSGPSPAPQVGSASLYITRTTQDARIRYVVFNAESGNADSDVFSRTIAYAGATHVAIQCVVTKATVVGSYKLLFSWNLPT